MGSPILSIVIGVFWAIIALIRFFGGESLVVSVFSLLVSVLFLTLGLLEARFAQDPKRRRKLHFAAFGAAILLCAAALIYTAIN